MTQITEVQSSHCCPCHAPRQVAYTFKQAAVMSGYSERTVRQAVYDGYLLARYANSKAVIRHADLEAWLDRLPAEPPGR